MNNFLLQKFSSATIDNSIVTDRKKGTQESPKNTKTNLQIIFSYKPVIMSGQGQGLTWPADCLVGKKEKKEWSVQFRRFFRQTETFQLFNEDHMPSVWILQE